jgi:predicted nucleic acid-binding protein
MKPFHWPWSLATPRFSRTTGKARVAAESRGLFTMGTITVLDLADVAGLLDFEDAASRLRATTFHIDSAVLDPVLAKVRARKQR